jgi:hypothetical protein
MLDHMLETEKIDIKYLLNVSPMRNSIYKGAFFMKGLQKDVGWSFRNKNKKYFHTHEDIILQLFTFLVSTSCHNELTTK